MKHFIDFLNNYFTWIITIMLWVAHCFSSTFHGTCNFFFIKELLYILFNSVSMKQIIDILGALLYTQHIWNHFIMQHIVLRLHCISAWGLIGSVTAHVSIAYTFHLSHYWWNMSWLFTNKIQVFGSDWFISGWLCWHFTFWGIFGIQNFTY